MIRTGDTLKNPVTGEVLRFVKAAADTGGEYVLVEVVVEPNGFVAAAHVHPYQTETFEILEGKVAFRAGKDTIVAKVGDTVRIDPGTPHKFWNDGETDALFRTEIRPALQFESLIETMFGLASDGKTNRRACRTRFVSRSSRMHTSTSCVCPSRRHGCRRSDWRSGTARPARRLQGDVRAGGALRGSLSLSRRLDDRASRGSTRRSGLSARSSSANDGARQTGGDDVAGRLRTRRVAGHGNQERPAIESDETEVRRRPDRRRTWHVAEE